MGYELHIFRKTNWNDDEEESNISLSEWLKYVESDEELQLTNGYQDVFKNWQDYPGFCEWKKHPQSDIVPWFSFNYGSVTAKYPDDYTIMKMIQIAAALNAKVQGDDEEYYDNSFFDKKQDEINEELKQLSEQKPADKKPWWKF
jgi:hypothetical protein